MANTTRGGVARRSLTRRGCSPTWMSCALGARAHLQMEVEMSDDDMIGYAVVLAFLGIVMLIAAVW